MALLNANVARFFFESEFLAPETFEVARFKGVEKISQPYQYEIDLPEENMVLRLQHAHWDW